MCLYSPSGRAIDTAIKSVKKGGTIILGVLGNDRDFLIFEEKIINGSVIGTRKDMAELVELARGSGLKVIVETHKLAGANEVLARLKKSEIEARAVLVPRNKVWYQLLKNKEAICHKNTMNT